MLQTKPQQHGSSTPPTETLQTTPTKHAANPTPHNDALTRLASRSDLVVAALFLLAHALEALLIASDAMSVPHIAQHHALG
eukprot:3202186-Rhodomonas_salina.2